MASELLVLFAFSVAARALAVPDLNVEPEALERRAASTERGARIDSLGRGFRHRCLGAG